MTRVHLFDGTGIEVRLHMFMDPTETYIHNHRSNFFSYCLSGRYWHKIWGVDERSEEGERYFVVNRTTDPLFEQPSDKPGSVSVIAAHTHQERGSYYIRSVTPHTVQPQMEGDRATPVLTIYIKDKAPGPDTLVRVAKMEELTSLREQQQEAQDCPLQGCEKLERLRAMHNLTRHADTLRKRPPLRV
ncbi:FCP [Symbiodinium microadriaticum]|nr:FCP [Symbiodinium microadriaticum]